MNKPFKILSSTAMAAALATTALVPTAAAEAPSEVPAPATQLAEVIFDDNGQSVSLDFLEYTEALAVNAVISKPTHVQAKDGSVYSLEEYSEALAVTLTPEKALETLYLAEMAVDLDVVAGKIVDKQVVAENKPEVTKDGQINIETVDTITADGITTEVVKFQILDKEGNVDKTANDVVLEIGSTYGYLSQTELTIQNGEGEVILRSEFLKKPTEAKITAQVIKAAESHEGLIGEITGEKTLMFMPAGTGQSGEQVTVKQVVSANSNQADRVTLFFDEEVTPADFYTVSEKNDNEVETLKNIRISNNKDLSEPHGIAGFLFDQDNPKAVTVLLDKDAPLKDNTDVYIEYDHKYDGAIVKTSKAHFKLADARTPNVTGVKVKDNKTLEVTFSEAVDKASFTIDGQFFEEEDFKVKHGNVEFKNGRYVDNRHVATITFNDYFKPGMHALEVSNIYDFAANTDPNNIGKTQVLEFEIKEDGTVAEATQEVHSPEQFKVAFDKPVKLDKDAFELQVWKEATKTEKGQWVKFEKDNFTGLKVTEVTEGVYKIELQEDWTEIYDTKNTKENYYNDEFRLVLPKESVTTLTNGNKNKEDIVLPLTKINGKETALATPDTTSPVISDIVKAPNFNAKENPTFHVQMSEPVKIKGLTDEEMETIAQTQKELPTTIVEFQGKDKNGKIRTFLGEIDKDAGFVDAWDTKFAVKWKEENGETPQTVVDAGGSTNWTVVVRSISDDIGNTAATVTKDFTLVKTPEVEAPEVDFRVDPKGGEAYGEFTEQGQGTTFAVKGEKGEFDTIEITYTKAVAVTGLGSATNVKNYTLNGKDLPTGASIALKREDGKVDEKTVVITLPKDTLLPLQDKDNVNNVITLAKQIKSKEGESIKHDLAFTFKTGSGIESALTNTDKTLKDLEDLIKDLEEEELLKTKEDVEAAKKALEDAKKKAEEVANKENATEDELKKAAEELNKANKAAKEAQKLAEAKAELEKAIKTNPATKYEDEDAAKELLDKAEGVLNKEDATAEEFEKAKKDLLDGLDKLDRVVKELKLSEIEGSNLTYDAISESTIAVIPLKNLSKTMKDAFENGKLYAEYNGEQFIFEVVTNPEQPDAVLNGYNVQDKSEVKVVIKEK